MQLLHGTILQYLLRIYPIIEMVLHKKFNVLITTKTKHDGDAEFKQMCLKKQMRNC